MADEKITDLTVGTPAADDLLAFVDISDTSMGSTGTDKKVELQDIPIDGAQLTGTVPDARIASTIARDSEVTAAVAALTAVYQALNAGLSAISLLTTTTYGRALLTMADASALRTVAALGSIATQGANNVSITGGSITGITDLAVADGGTGASDAAGARTNLGLGNAATLTVDADLATFALPASTTISSFVAAALDETTVGAFLTALGIDADVATFAVPASTTISSFVSGALDETTIAAFLTALGLDADLATLALPASTTITAFGASLIDDVNAAAAIATLGLDADLATFALPASTTISAYGATLTDDVDAATARGTLGLGSIATQASSNVTITGGSVTGITDVAIADGGTGQSTAAAGFDALSPVTTRGDLIYRNATTNARLAKGTAGQFLQQGANDPAWFSLQRVDVFANRGAASSHTAEYFFATDDPVASTGTQYYSDGSTWTMVSTTKGELARAVRTSNGTATSGTTISDLTGGSITFTLATDRAVKVIASCLLSNDTAAITTLSIRVGSTKQIATGIAAAAVTANIPQRIHCEVPLDLVAGTYTYLISYEAPVSGIVTPICSAGANQAYIEAVLL